MTRTDRSIRVLLSIVAVLLGANLLAHFIPAASIPTARAGGIPDSAAEFQSMIDQLTETNKKLDKMETYLESGALTVKVKDPKADKDK